MTAATPLLHLAVGCVRAVMIGISAMLIVVGATQIVRTLRLGSSATNPDDVIQRSGVLIGAGAALLFAATAIL